MQFRALLLAALASSVAMANYNIQLYEHRNCRRKIGKTCSNKRARSCCTYDDKKFKSARFEETGDKPHSTDQLKLYTDSNCGGPPIEQHIGTGCVSRGKKDVKSAQVFIIIGDGDENNAGPVKRVEPDEAFMEEGLFRYTIKRDSPEGREYDKLKRLEDRADYLRLFGKREEITESEE
ncbi:hypothetical protein F4776DRAFT_660425 [Hypoxylon sp. NC0597]|nr:hypothetical protein F4776DRAFT_660425 [Hypoxylon sp. NC0597]